MTRSALIAGALCGPLSGPFAYGCVRCVQSRRYVMAGWYAAATVEAYVWRGAGHPEDEPHIVRHYHAKKAALYALLGLDYRIPIKDDKEDG